MYDSSIVHMGIAEMHEHLKVYCTAYIILMLFVIGKQFDGNYHHSISMLQSVYNLLTIVSMTTGAHIPNSKTCSYTTCIQ